MAKIEDQYIYQIPQNVQSRARWGSGGAAVRAADILSSEGLVKIE